MPYYDEPYATAWYDEDADAVVGELTEFTDGEAFRTYMEALIDAIEDTGTDTILADTSEFDSALTEEDQVWSVRDWAPRAEEAGLEHMAMVMPEAVVAEMSVDSIVEMADDSLNRELFDDFEAAKAWARER
ncbi:hypothetical protein GJ629_09750 [Halapricum sp. CBA1109]|uniref:hypothetical protein n=1 Tax=Halapricum sp. CBA1109 TaxID=2668068 RepID=UPI0012F9F2F3|nr:hypothetical protein [Halapricum sp. CBA1109]MUV90137.1 hypothetical protein [Halapricum sp. CBA1109]